MMIPESVICAPRQNLPETIFYGQQTVQVGMNVAK